MWDEGIGEKIVRPRQWIWDNRHELVSAVVFLLSAAAFTFDGDGMHWMWKDTPIVGAVLAAVSLAFWAFFAVRLIRSRRGRTQRS
jgi:hypothetical protein